MGLFDFFKRNPPKPQRVITQLNLPMRQYRPAVPLTRSQIPASVMDRTNSSFFSLGQNDPNEEYRNSIDNLRASSRQLTVQNPHARGFYHALDTNVVGEKGVVFVPKVRRGGPKSALNNTVNTELKRAWSDWAKRPTVDGRGTWVDFQSQALHTVAEDGECFVQIIIDRELNKYGIALKILPADRLDHRYDKMIRKADGSITKIVQGIELDKFDRPVAYWFWNKHPRSRSITFPLKRIRIPAAKFDRKGLVSGILHLQYTNNDRANTLRSTPWVVPSLTWLARLNQYLDAEIISAVTAARAPVYIKTPADDPTQYEGPSFRDHERDITSTDDDGSLIKPKKPEVEVLEIDNATMIRTAPGEEVQPTNIARTTDTLTPTTALFLHAIAAGLGISYATLTTDMTKESYASGRLGVRQERDTWKKIQSWFIRSLHENVYDAWIRAALISRQAQLEGPPSNFMTVEFRGRGWPWVDQLREVKAIVEMMRMGLHPPSNLAEEFGRDYEETVTQTAADFEFMREAGLGDLVEALLKSNTSLQRPPPDGVTPAEEENE